jgi:hypothetical protein
MRVSKMRANAIHPWPADRFRRYFRWLRLKWAASGSLVGQKSARCDGSFDDYLIIKPKKTAFSPPDQRGRLRQNRLS